VSVIRLGESCSKRRIIMGRIRLFSKGRIASRLIVVFAAAVFHGHTRTSGGDTACHHSGGADIIVGEITSVANYMRQGEKDAFSVGQTFCNLGDEEADYMFANNRHPLLSQNLYRFRDGRFEQLGLSWLPHGFIALSSNQCQCGCTPTGGSMLGVGCSTSDSASINGQQLNMGPRYEVNAHTGSFLVPFTLQGMTGDSIFKRLQARTTDLEPSSFQTARYFFEAQVISPDDAANGFQNNNASYRETMITQNGAERSATLTGATVREQPAIRAWRAIDPEVLETDVPVPNEGLFILAAKAEHIAAGVWHYEYALHNLNSDRSAGTFSVPVVAEVTVSEIGFHDVDYHSGEPFNGTDWDGTHVTEFVQWATIPFEVDENANALRWGTLYNFRFNANRPPTHGAVVIGLFKPGNPNEVTASTIVPSAIAGDYNEDGAIDLLDQVGWPNCLNGPSAEQVSPPCTVLNLDVDANIDMFDFAIFVNGFGQTSP
jgi:hypothetical protein